MKGERRMPNINAPFFFQDLRLFVVVLPLGLTVHQECVRKPLGKRLPRDTKSKEDAPLSVKINYNTFIQKEPHPMNGSATKLLQFMANPSALFLIPVYQRRYSWERSQCEQLMEDLLRIHQERAVSHFFGSVVLKGITRGAKTEYTVIDGQQRLTTISLLLLALMRLLETAELKAEKEPMLANQIRDFYLLTPYALGNEAIRLRLVREDAEDYQKLLGIDGGTPKQDAILTANYQYLTECLRHLSIPPEALFDALTRLEIICITLDDSDNPQLIFESLNSTGLALTEGDKVRNYILMDLPYKTQTRLYNQYWAPIEQRTNGAVSALLRDVLSIKCQETPRQDAVYQTFKRRMGGPALDNEAILQTLARYAEWFALLNACGKACWNGALQGSLYRLKRLDMTVVRPFALEVLRLYSEELLTEEDLTKIFSIIESYLFRRAICGVPTSALNKIFPTLNAEILKLDPTAKRYVDILAYILLSRQGSSTFPTDSQFKDSLSTRQIYSMSKKYTHYLFERLENGDTLETKAVYAHLDRGEYTIEHIMPQHLTQAWREELGERCEDIHATWLHRLANLTLSAYNPSLSDNPFTKKRDSPKDGYRDSGIRMNQRIGQCERWGEAELKERNAALCEQAIKIWPCPTTDFKPVEKQWDTCTLEEADATLTGRKISRYRWKGAEYPVVNWTDMYVRIIQVLHNRNPLILRKIAANQQLGAKSLVTLSKSMLRYPQEIDDGLYLECNFSTLDKAKHLRELFEAFDEDPEELVFCLLPTKQTTGLTPLTQARYDYWQYLLPDLRAACDCFAHRHSSKTSKLGTPLEVPEYQLACIVTRNLAAVYLIIWMATKEQNKVAFDKLIKYKSEIETRFGKSLLWHRMDKHRISFIEYQLKGINLLDKKDWERMRTFHIDGCVKMREAFDGFLIPPP